MGKQTNLRWFLFILVFVKNPKHPKLYRLSLYLSFTNTYGSLKKYHKEISEKLICMQLYYFILQVKGCVLAHVGRNSRKLNIMPSIGDIR